MDFSPEYVINQYCKNGSVFRMTAPDLIGTSIPHFFIIMAIDGEDNFFVICTTKVHNREKYFKLNRIDSSCLVPIENDDQNGLTALSWVDCTRSFRFNRDNLVNKLKNEEIEYRGEISYNHYDQIRQGIHNNDISDIPKFLLNHPED